MAVSETNQDEVLVIPKELTISEKISAAAERYGADKSLALNIACAESIFDPLADNRYSSADGIYQFLDGTWRHYGLKHWGSLDGRSKKNADDNIDLGVWVIATYGTSDWNESKWHGYGGGWSRQPFENGLCA